MERCSQKVGVAVLLSFAACGQPTPDTRSSASDSKVPPPASPSTTPTTPTTPPTPVPPPTPTTGTSSPRTTPRLIAPLSSSISTSMRPMLTWLGESASTGVTVDVCRDRACQNVIVSFAATGSSAQPPQPLPAGVVFWRVTSATTGGRTSAVWELNIPARDSGRQGSWGSVPDFDGDGFADLAVGVLPASGTGTPPPNEMRVFPGGPSGLAAAPAQTLTGPAGFAEEAGSAGDLDGDGFADLAIWNSVSSSASLPGGFTVTIYRGGPQGLSSPVTIPAPDADVANQMRVLSAGDVNGDGYGDLLVGGDAAAALYLGGPTGVSATPIETLSHGAATSAQWPIGDGDFNGDGHPDAFITGPGGGLLYEGDGQTLVAHPEFTPFVSFGGLAGDVNGDGFADLAVGGAVYTGSPTLPMLFEVLAGQMFYQGVGDVDGDGFSDVLNSVSSIVGVREAERVYFGGVNPCTSNACPTFVPLFVPGDLNDGSPRFAVGAKGIGDVNGDGFFDFVYFSPGAGAVYLFLGSPAGPPSNPSRTITAEQGFGFSVAGM
ncbi:MAG TPA: VCBS repeat-containing protein [Polyangia bacterium]|nr:VCBS repeat-containing protein [Polyangia bacterium]